MKLNKNIIYVAGFLILLLLSSINFNDLSNSSNFGSYIGIFGLATFIVLKIKK
ncbi:hypothetical protein EV195_105245 [Tenacibaculum skagerrakense]|uniref:Uncharacterized protein n=1 Tax=Tenacibaculum skagerrakense TaxID=186571 RepID=A0A4R2NTJ7_9FLAO|nr:hypothetical protein EV195_105245 [Tenacibaculum skagerrakense]